MSTEVKIPTEVPVVPRLNFPSTPLTESNVYYNSGETMRGYMMLIGPDKHRQAVHVIVYRTSLEHFAVVYPQKRVCRPLGVLNLRNTFVERLPNQDDGFLVQERGFDRSMSITFIIERPMDLEEWIRAFTSRSSPSLHHSSLPIVEEEDF